MPIATDQGPAYLPPIITLSINTKLTWNQCLEATFSYYERSIRPCGIRWPVRPGRWVRSPHGQSALQLVLSGLRLTSHSEISTDACPDCPSHTAKGLLIHWLTQHKQVNVARRIRRLSQLSRVVLLHSQGEWGRRSRASYDCSMQSLWHYISH
jgi:hypothetical protein